jgi:hypothetical protein
MHLHEWGTSFEGEAESCCVECITPSFLIFFQFGEKTQWIIYLFTNIKSHKSHTHTNTHIISGSYVTQLLAA